MKKFIAITALFASCTFPTFDGDVYSVEEIYSVWQYLNVYSIFQDRIPSEREIFYMTPEELMLKIADTLKGGNFTRYHIPPPPRQPGGGGGGGGIPLIPPDTVIAVTDETVYFRFRSFDNLALSIFSAHVPYMSGFDNIIIDVRNNGGGFLNIVAQMVSEFLPYNTDFIKYQRRVYDRQRRMGKDVEEIDRSFVVTPALTGKNIVVIANANSASASEILVSALIDRANATFLGNKTYGKAIGQTNLMRGDRPMLIITSMQISGLTERTGAYHITGITPDDVNEEYVLEAETELEEKHAPLYELFQSDAYLYYAIKSAQPDVTDLTNDDSQSILGEFINFAISSPWKRAAEDDTHEEMNVLITESISECLFTEN